MLNLLDYTTVSRKCPFKMYLGQINSSQSVYRFGINKHPLGKFICLYANVTGYDMNELKILHNAEAS